MEHAWIDLHPDLFGSALIDVRLLSLIFGWALLEMPVMYLRGRSLAPRVRPPRGLWRSPVLLLLALAALLDPGVSAADLGLRAPDRVPTWVSFVIVMMLASQVGDCIGRILRATGRLSGRAVPLPRPLEVDSPDPAGFAIAAIVYPIQNELWLRGIVLGVAIGPLGMDPVVAVALVAVLGMRSGASTANQVVLFIWSIALGSVYLGSGSLWLPMAVQVAAGILAAISLWVALTARQRSAATSATSSLTWSNSMCADLWLIAIGCNGGRTPRDRVFRRCLRVALVVDLVRCDVVRLTPNGFVDGQGTTVIAPAARIALLLARRPLSALDLVVQRWIPSLNRLLADLSGSPRCRARASGEQRSDVSDADPRRTAALVDAIARISSGEHVPVDATGAALAFLAFRAGLFTPQWQAMDAMQRQTGELAPVLQRASASLVGVSARRAHVASR